jgi:uncharacterized protein (TIGR02391 family)
MKREIKKKPKIEFQEILGEIGRRSYEMLRLSRIKYVHNPHIFLDLRLFQRGYDSKSEDDVFFPTKYGVQFKEEQFQGLLERWTHTQVLLLHPLIMKKSYLSFKKKEYDTAVFNAFKAVEIRVHGLSGLPEETIGVDLIRKAFSPDNGPLADTSAPVAEREALSHLFSGAIGCYKNPHSHREVKLSFNEAFEMLILASHLLHILDKITKNAKRNISLKLKA